MSEIEMPTVFRTPRDGCFENYTGAWGTYLRAVDDPDANVILSKEDFKAFTLKEEIHKIPADLWQRWVQLCFHFVDKVASNLEVSIRILRSEEDPSKYRFIVPRQEVTAASVRANDFGDSIDIETGEVIEQYPPVGWIPVGSSHSHNTMAAFFSGTDDKYELGDPGIHIVVGSIKLSTRNYSIAASVVGNGRRFTVSHNDLLDATPVDDCSFHPDVLEFVKVERPVERKQYSKNFYQEWSKQTQNISWTDRKKYDDFSDPFHYTEDVFESAEHFQRLIQKDTPSTEIDIWNVEDPIVDYVNAHENDMRKIEKLRNLLQSWADDLDVLLDKSEPTLYAETATLTKD